MPQDKPKEPKPEPGPRPSDKPKDPPPKEPKEPTPRPNALSQAAFEEPIVDNASIRTNVIAADASEEEMNQARTQALCEVEVFEHRDFKGDSWRTSFGYSYVGSDWNDKISSIIVYSGWFEFYEHRDFGSEHWGPVRLGVGQYAFVGDVGIWNDTISSWKAFF